MIPKFKCDLETVKALRDGNLEVLVHFSKKNKKLSDMYEIFTSCEDSDTLGNLDYNKDFWDKFSLYDEGKKIGNIHDKGKKIGNIRRGLAVWAAYQGAVDIVRKILKDYDKKNRKEKRRILRECERYSKNCFKDWKNKDKVSDENTEEYKNKADSASNALATLLKTGCYSEKEVTNSIKIASGWNKWRWRFWKFLGFTKRAISMNYVQEEYNKLECRIKLPEVQEQEEKNIAKFKPLEQSEDATATVPLKAEKKSPDDSRHEVGDGLVVGGSVDGSNSDEDIATDISTSLFSDSDYNRSNSNGSDEIKDTSDKDNPFFLDTRDDDSAISTNIRQQLKQQPRTISNVSTSNVSMMSMNSDNTTVPMNTSSSSSSDSDGIKKGEAKAERKRDEPEPSNTSSDASYGGYECEMEELNTSGEDSDSYSSDITDDDSKYNRPSPLTQEGDSKQFPNMSVKVPSARCVGKSLVTQDVNKSQYNLT